MNPTLASKSAVTTKAQIRWLVLWFAACIWGSGIIFGLGSGKTFQQANSDGAAAAIAGLTSWTVYHMVSRRNDGLAIVMASLPAAM